ncbi:MAG: hypothetical protein J3K34DRAFT_445863 [Monoraphidium minutum]|nr:MAG: hypothetical protein J3K34DRAFT_445863 [Monoraphidium minutum]
MEGGTPTDEDGGKGNCMRRRTRQLPRWGEGADGAPRTQHPRRGRISQGLRLGRRGSLWRHALRCAARRAGRGAGRRVAVGRPLARRRQPHGLGGFARRLGAKGQVVGHLGTPGAAGAWPGARAACLLGSWGWRCVCARRGAVRAAWQLRIRSAGRYGPASCRHSALRQVGGGGAGGVRGASVMGEDPPLECGMPASLSCHRLKAATAQRRPSARARCARGGGRAAKWKNTAWRRQPRRGLLCAVQSAQPAAGRDVSTQGVSAFLGWGSKWGVQGRA